MNIFVLLLVPFLCWVFCFFHFFDGSLHLQADAISYAEHIKFYLDHLSQGVYPLWDPTWFNGVPNDFFLRRIGDVNPFLWLMIVLKWVGIPTASAYLIFLGFYYFLAAWAVYLISRLLFTDIFLSFTAYVLFLFSSWGSEVFYNYIVIIFVPIIWFFYFLISFFRAPKKSSFLGICFCSSLILTTYIPFFFLTILAVFLFFYISLYWKDFLNFIDRTVAYIKANKAFVVFCLIFVMISCIPAVLFYKESKRGEFVLPKRHSGAETVSAVGVGLNSVEEGDIISHGYFDRIFDHHAELILGDIYIPYFFFLILLVTFFARVNKLMFFLLFNVLVLLLISVTSASGVHRFLYEHLIFFKFIRNIYYFFWLAILPMSIFFAVSAFQSLLNIMHHSKMKTYWLCFVIFCHLLFGVFLLGRHGVLWGAWAAVIFSFVYFLVHFFYERKISSLIGFLLILLSVLIQSAQVYSFLEKKLFKIQQDEVQYNLTHPNPSRSRLDTYYVSNWFALLVNVIDPQTLDEYRTRQFIFYDNLFRYKDGSDFYKSLQLSMKNLSNIAYISEFESSPDDVSQNMNDPKMPVDSNPVGSGALKVLYNDTNTWKLSSHLPKARFLVVNDNYNHDWNVYINGQKTRLYRANLSFKGFWVPAGESRILLRFSNPEGYVCHFMMIFLFLGVFLYLLVLLRIDSRCILHEENKCSV